MDFVIAEGDRVLPGKSKPTGAAVHHCRGLAQLPGGLPARHRFGGQPGLAHKDRIGETEVEWVLPQRLSQRVEEVFGVTQGP